MPQALILAIKVSCYTAVGRSRGPTAYVAFWVMPITHIQQIFVKTFLKYYLRLSSCLPAVKFWLSENACYCLMSRSGIRLDIILAHLPYRIYIYIYIYIYICTHTHTHTQLLLPKVSKKIVLIYLKETTPTRFGKVHCKIYITYNFI